MLEVPQLISSGIAMDLPYGGTDSETDSDDIGGCFFCNKTIETRPYWRCVECDGESLRLRLHYLRCLMLPSDSPYICFECNKQHDVEAPWQLQRKPADDGAHDYMHVLILASEEAADEEEADDRLAALDAKLEEKVGVLQGRLDDIESTITTRLQTLEDLLQHLVATVPNLRQV